MAKPTTWDKTKNALFYGDNFDILRAHIPDEMVDLIYLDPPFNSARDYSLLFKEKDGTDSAAQLVAFEDTWTWNQASDLAYRQITSDPATPSSVVDAIEALRTLIGETDLLAYLVMMTQRLVQLRRVLKPAGLLYLHCDPTASHYLKIILDALFGPERFVSEIIWKRTSAHNRVRRFGPVHDVILAYAKGDKWTWNPQYVPYDQDYIDRDYRRIEEGTGRRYRISDMTSNNPGSRYEWKGITPEKRYWAYSKERMEEFEAEGRIHYSSTGYPQLKKYLDDMPGQLVQDVWTDIQPINNRAAEKLGYPTQKPLALLERIIKSSTNEGDLVLDPFCGCGTAVDAAQRLNRRWVGIDITTLSVDLMDSRLRFTYGDSVRDTYEILGVPRDVSGAHNLFKRSPFEFERWCVTQIGGQPNERQVGDKGIDGVVRFPIDAKGNTGKIIVSVKGGATNPGHVRDLLGTVKSQKAAMGIFICMGAPTRGMVDAANTSGTYSHPATGQDYPVIQIMTVQDLIDLKRPNAPGAINPYYSAKKYVENQVDVELF